MCSFLDNSKKLASIRERLKATPDKLARFDALRLGIKSIKIERSKKMAGLLLASYKAAERGRGKDAHPDLLDI